MNIWNKTKQSVKKWYGQNGKREEKDKKYGQI